jgi:hypothetical protein
VQPSLEVWLDNFCTLHGRARRGELSPADREQYLAARDELAGALLKAQRIALHAGEQPRRTLRAAAMLPVCLHLPGGDVEAITRDVSAGGFSVTLERATVPDGAVRFSLRLARDHTVTGHARLVAFTAGKDSPRASFCFETLSPEAIEQIELTVFDAVVNQLWT